MLTSPLFAKRTSGACTSTVSADPISGARAEVWGQTTAIIALTCGFAGRRRRASASLDAREASVRHSIGGETPRPRAEPFRTGHEYVGLRSHPLRLAAGGLTRAFKQGDSHRSDLRPARPTPQVTRVMGVFDRHRHRKSSASAGPRETMPEPDLSTSA